MYVCTAKIFIWFFFSSLKFTYVNVGVYASLYVCMYVYMYERPGLKLEKLLIADFRSSRNTASL